MTEMQERRLRKLSAKIDEALFFANDLDQKMTVYLLSVASLEVSIQLEALENSRPEFVAA